MQAAYGNRTASAREAELDLGGESDGRLRVACGLGACAYDAGMHPVFLKIGGVTIHSYGVMMALALLAAVAVWHILARRANKAPGYASDVGVWLMVSGLLGARIAFVVANYRELFAHDPWSMLRIDQGGLIYYGGMIGSVVGMTIFSRLRGEEWFATADRVITPIPLAHALGRVGCFLNGCCMGSPYTGWCSYELNGVYRHPVQLYEAVLNVLVFAFLFRLHGRRRFRGQVFAAYLLTYPVVRFGIEFLRGDERLQVGPLTVAQLLSLSFLVLGLVLWFACRRLPVEADARAAEEAEDDAASADGSERG